MKRIIISDLKTVFRSKRLWISLALFVFSASVNIIEQFTLAGLNLKGGLDLFAFGNINFVSIISVLAPFIPSFVLSPLFIDDFNSVYQSRQSISLKKYIYARSLSSALIGMGIFIIPHLIMLIISFGIDPTLSAQYFEPWGEFANIYSTNAMLFVVVFFLYSALFGALYGLLSTGIGMLSKNYWMAIVLPGIIYHCSRYLWPYCDNPLLNWMKFFPGGEFDFNSGVPLWMRIGEFGTVFLLSIILIFISYFRINKEWHKLKTTSEPEGEL